MKLGLLVAIASVMVACSTQKQVSETKPTKQENALEKANASAADELIKLYEKEGWASTDLTRTVRQAILQH
jgi:hypothetical protein